MIFPSDRELNSRDRLAVAPHADHVGAHVVMSKDDTCVCCHLDQLIVSTQNDIGPKTQRNQSYPSSVRS